jgi:putative ABC transport system permease protein
VFSTLNVDGQVVPFMFEPPGSSIAPPLLSGHEVEGPGQIVIGPATLAALHKHVGDSVVIGAQGRQGTVRVVGEATFPAIGVNGTFHPSTGTGAVASSQFLPPPDRVCGPETNMVLVRMRPGTSSAAALAGTDQIASETNHIFAKEPTNTDCSDDLVSVLSVQRPAEIVNYRSIGSTPGLLAAALTVAAAAALGLTLVASARRRRRDMATLKALGFTRRQLLSAVCWQASILVGIGVIVGAPLGIVLGRWSWVLFARDIYVVPEPAVPVLSLVLVVVGALVFANIVATLPGRIAARTPVAIVFRSE